MSAPRSTRREFLQGQAAADALAAAVAGDTAGDLPPLEARPAEPYLLRLARQAMACTFEVFLNAGQYDGDTDRAMAALDLIDALEDQLSVYRPQSEISRLNRTAAESAVAVEPRLFALLVQAVELHRDTGGAFDVTAGPLSSVWGFTRRGGQLPQPEALEAARCSVGSQWLELDPAEQTVRYSKSGLEINLGSIGKGYALDRAAELLEGLGISDFLLHGGSSSVLARGARGDAADGWTVGVRDPLHPRRRLGQLRLAHRALGTSGSGTQYFLHEGRRLGHILDPRTGWPAEGVLSVSVLAPTAAEADALATAFYVMGPQVAGDYCRAHPAVAAVMTCPGPREGSLRTRVFGLDESAWTPLVDAGQA